MQCEVKIDSSLKHRRISDNSWIVPWVGEKNVSPKYRLSSPTEAVRSGSGGCPYLSSEKASGRARLGGLYRGWLAARAAAVGPGRGALLPR